MKNMSKTLCKFDAIRHARKMVSAPSRIGDGWKYSVFNPELNAWQESQSAHLYAMRESRSQRLLDIAREAMGLEPVILDVSNAYWHDQLPPSK